MILYDMFVFASVLYNQYPKHMLHSSPTTRESIEVPLTAGLGAGFAGPSAIGRGPDDPHDWTP